MTKSNTLLPSAVVPTEQDFISAEAMLQQEYEWYSGAKRYRSDRNIRRAIRRGHLVLVEGNENYLPVSRFSLGVDGYTPYVATHTKRVMDCFGQVWRQILASEHGIDDDSLRLAITSMVRPRWYQNRLVKAGRLASKQSTHCTGGAWDTDGSGYYVVLPDGGFESRVHPARRAERQRISQQIREMAGSDKPATTQGESYDQRVMDAAWSAGRLLHLSGAINLVEEFKDTNNSCLHIAANPDF